MRATHGFVCPVQRALVELLEAVISDVLAREHLASAISIRDQISAFVTDDKRLRDAAEVEGLTVVSPGAE
ncbi:Uncharacterised protein (plasmid) [Tsukamurella tyrosinosolvens]|uniref:hypothetical protein n=1 Tax=Tsukamurella tyrosinosolvens TaxID=57704 RepID=UPI0007922D98|nr:hypothetical protein [Tsukamurella tyrosinosolvens]AUN42468.1 hypothetical protein ASU32_22615 [Tsukamurella tyrosinosolvens]KXO92662.1 hypothetical protein AXK58_18830 [Tsukamurella tyrosinosolvens]MEC4612115.1 hypothetical protein [Tsukamurella tyrosinosolvens]RDB47349.1 hypothetical protein DVB87_13675 [Tsukamurella tyrosinosolvens]VEH88643.1 Uncharacterised protein [Tsukamurella tyrosinosolvens]